MRTRKGVPGVVHESVQSVRRYDRTPVSFCVRCEESKEADGERLADRTAARSPAPSSPGTSGRQRKMRTQAPLASQERMCYNGIRPAWATTWTRATVFLDSRYKAAMLQNATPDRNRCALPKEAEGYEAALAVGASGSDTPIMLSLVTRAASSSSDMPSVPSGLFGRTR